MKRPLTLLFALLCTAFASYAQEDVIRLGIIGLDTSHSTAFTQLLNTPGEDPYVQRFEVVAAYPYGSSTIESSYRRIPAYIEEVKKYGVRICSSISEMLDLVDCVLLETNDGRLHMEQAVEVFKAAKLCYVDKPAGATLGETIALYRLAQEYGIQIFSSSALRYSPENVKLREGAYGKVLGADCYSPHHPEPTHPDFGFYGIHGVETLYTVMGPGCKSVSRVHSDYGDIVSGVWEDGRLGTFRAVSKGPNIYGGTAITETGTVAAGGYMGYKVLLDKILDYFLTGQAPIDPKETIEIFAFMKASNMSLERGGAAVSIEEAMELGRKDAAQILKEYLPVKLSVVDPGHFHASLVFKNMQKGIDPVVRVYSPVNVTDLSDFRIAISEYNGRADNPCGWQLQEVVSRDYLDSLPQASGLEAVILSGRNDRKAQYILAAVEKGYNVLSDKPMAIDEEGLHTLEKAYALAQQKGLVIMDMMTERYDIVNILSRDILADKALFGEFDSSDGPAVKMRSVHHFFKKVDGKTLHRPVWYYDTSVQGEGIADVTTHLVDLLMWQCFPGQSLGCGDVTLLAADHYPTKVTYDQYVESTCACPIDRKDLQVMSNGSIDFSLAGIPARIEVLWNWEAKKGRGDSFEALYKGTGCDLTVRQNPGDSRKELYLRGNVDLCALQAVCSAYEGLSVEQSGKDEWHIVIPQSLRISHEDHFNLVAGRFFDYLRGEKVPDWEAVNTLSKYYLTTSAVTLANGQ